MSYYANCDGSVTFKKLSPMEMEREAKRLRRELILLDLRNKRVGRPLDVYFDSGYAELLNVLLDRWSPVHYERVQYDVWPDDGAGKTVSFYDYEKYDGYVIDEFLNTIAPMVSDGCLYFTGEDGAAWRFRFHDGAFHEEDGETIYENEGYVAPEKYLPMLEESITSVGGQTFAILSIEQLQAAGFCTPTSVRTRSLISAFSCSTDELAKALILSAMEIAE